MTLYEIDSKILECVDSETGEVIDEEKLNQLEIERNSKISQVACWRKSLVAEAKAIKEEKMALAKRQQACENKANSLDKWIEYALNGEKFKDARVSISYRKTESVQVEDPTKLPVEFQKITIEPKKTELKEAIKSGQSFEGVTLEEKNNLIFK